VWACRRNFQIVLWNRRCEERYGCSRANAIGRNFFGLFVHDHERDQAEKDCIRIIDEGTVFVNFIADDHDATGKQIRVLTNCFRVWDERFKEWIQAEIGVDISDFETSADRHRTIREVGKKIQELKMHAAMQEFLAQKQDLRLKLRDSHAAKIRTWQARNDAALNLTERLESLVTDDGREKIAEKMRSLDSIRAEIESRLDALDERVAKARGIEELEAIRQMIAEFALWHPPGLSGP
jgi:PAS domain S-box-containing protein